MITRDRLIHVMQCFSTIEGFICLKGEHISHEQNEIDYNYFDIKQT